MDKTENIFSTKELPSLNARIKLLVDKYANGSVKRFSEIINLSSSQKLNRIFNLDKRNGEYPEASSDILVSIANMFSEVNKDWLLTGHGPMLHIDQKQNESAIISYDPNVGVPYYDVDFAAGFSLLYNDQTITPTYNIIFKPFEDAQFWCNVTGRSMEPKLSPGDIVALKEIPSIDDILYGEIYAVVLKNMRTIKIIRKANDPNMLRFVPINTDSFDEQVFPKDYIDKIFVVMGCISKFS